MSDLLKEKSSSALFWNFIDKGGQQAIQLIFIVILARLVTPEGFGLIGLIAVFPVIANILQESGFSSALIRKKNPDQSDYSSVFYFNIGISIFMYMILYFAAPLIATYYETPILTDLSRVVFLTFIFNAFGIVQNVHLHRKMDFQSNAKITFVAGLSSGLVAIWAAYTGYGVWSIVIQQVLQAFIRNLLLWLFIRWRPSWVFSTDKLKAMLPYSFKLLVTHIFNQIGGYFYVLIIGKQFSITQAGYYTQANKLNSIPQSVIGSSMQGVAYPLLTKVDDKERMKRVFRKIIRVAAFICFPVAILIIISAKSIILIVLSDRYIESIPILQILAISGAVYPLYALINSLQQALGKSGLLLKIETTRNILLIGSALISIKFGIIGLVMGFSIVHIIAFSIAFLCTGKYISYRLIEIFKDITPYIIISLIAFLPVFFLNKLVENDLLLLVLQSIIGGSIYLFIIKILGSKVMEDCLDFIKNKKTQ